jgi:hypothetical protein
MNATICYYTANTEDESFEMKIRDNILQVSGGLPIISVSRKPIDFGENICVGEQPVCYANSIRQLLVGLRAAKTRFVIAAESDVLYPPEYFQFTPRKIDRVYRYANVWILYTWTSRRYYGKFWQKKYTESAQMCGREHWIRSIENIIDGDAWGDTMNPPLVFERGVRGCSWSGNPVITCKTPYNLGRYTTTSYISTETLPYWGNISDVIRSLQ